MKSKLTVMILGVVLGGGIVNAQDPSSPRCQTLASKFSEDPEALSMTELERLRFCVIQALEHRQKTLNDGLLKGTIIEPPSSMQPPQETQPPPRGQDVP